jgi:hypothetical protein
MSVIQINDAVAVDRMHQTVTILSVQHEVGITILLPSRSRGQWRGWKPFILSTMLWESGVMVWCFHESQEIEEGYGSKAPWKGCFGQKYLRRRRMRRIASPQERWWWLGATMNNRSSKALCKGCYDTIAPKDEIPNRKAMRANATEAITQQGHWMRKYAQENRGKKGILQK